MVSSFQIKICLLVGLFEPARQQQHPADILSPVILRWRCFVRCLILNNTREASLHPKTCSQLISHRARKNNRPVPMLFNQHKHRPSCWRRYWHDSKGIWGKFLSESNLDSSQDADENCNPEAYFHLSELRRTCFCLVLWQLFRYVLKRSVVTGWVWNKNRKESVVLVWWRRLNKST